MCKDRGKCDQKEKRLYRNRCINYKTDGVSNMNDKITFINIFTMLKNLKHEHNEEGIEKLKNKTKLNCQRRKIKYMK